MVKVVFNSVFQYFIEHSIQKTVFSEWAAQGLARWVGRIGHIELVWSK